MIPEKVGRYQIKSELGRGGMATVYRALDPSFEREVAVKVLPREVLHDPQFQARFEREAKTIAALEHPAIVPVYDFGQDAGQPYLVMRYMPGGTLSDKLQDGPLSLQESARIFNQLSEALDLAHAQGLVHRDLKPSNILFDQRGNAYISDFGIVKISDASIQYTQGIIGTPAYMSPEQARGNEEIDKRSDIYALGAILFEMLTGELPYKADTPMGLALAHISEPVPRILEQRSDLPAEAESIIARAMAKEPESRFATATALANAVSNLTEADTTTAPAGAATVIEPLPEPPATVVEPVPAAAPAPAPVIPPAGSFAPGRKGLPRWVLGVGCGVVLLIVAVVAIVALGGGGALLLASQATPTPIPSSTNAPTATPAATATVAPTATVQIVLPTLAPQDADTRITVLNTGVLEICGVYIALSADDTWGANQLTGSIRPGDSQEFPIEAQISYDVRVDDCDGRNVAEERGVTANSGGAARVLAATGAGGVAQVTLINNGSAPVCFVNFSLSTEDSWGPERLATESIIQTGQTVTFDISSAGAYDFRALDCDRNTLSEFFSEQINAGEDLTWEIES